MINAEIVNNSRTPVTGTRASLKQVRQWLLVGVVLYQSKVVKIIVYEIMYDLGIEHSCILLSSTPAFVKDASVYLRHYR